MLLAGSPSTGAATALTANIQVSVSPIPATSPPGTTGALSWSLKNGGTADAYRIEARLTGLDPGIVVTDESTQDLGLLSAGSSTEASPFRYSVPASTAPGFYHASFAFDYLYNNGTAVQYTGFTVTATIVVRGAPTLGVASVVPDQIEPGQVTGLALTLHNDGPARFLNLICSWTSVGNAILPVGGSNELQVPKVEPNSSLVLPLRVTTSAAIVPGLYPLTFVLRYNDAAGNVYNSTSSVGVVVGGSSDVGVTLQNLTDKKVSLSITNTGLNPLSGVQVQLIPLDGIALDGGDTVVLAKLASGAFGTASFDTKDAPSRSGSVRVRVDLSYTDSLGARHNESRELNLSSAAGSTYSNGEIVALSVGGLLAAEALVGGAVLGRRAAVRRRRAKADSAPKTEDPLLESLVAVRDQVDADLHRQDEELGPAPPRP